MGEHKRVKENCNHSGLEKKELLERLTLRFTSTKVELNDMRKNFSNNSIRNFKVQNFKGFMSGILLKLVNSILNGFATTKAAAPSMERG